MKTAAGNSTSWYIEAAHCLRKALLLLNYPLPVLLLFGILIGLKTVPGVEVLNFFSLPETMGFLWAIVSGCTVIFTLPEPLSKKGSAQSQLIALVRWIAMGEKLRASSGFLALAVGGGLFVALTSIVHFAYHQALHYLSLANVPSWEVQVVGTAAFIPTLCFIAEILHAAMVLIKYGADALEPVPERMPI